jgi:hypothetical protein
MKLILSIILFLSVITSQDVKKLSIEDAQDINAFIDQMVDANLQWSAALQHWVQVIDERLQYTKKICNCDEKIFHLLIFEPNSPKVPRRFRNLKITEAQRKTIAEIDERIEAAKEECEEWEQKSKELIDVKRARLHDLVFSKYNIDKTKFKLDFEQMVFVRMSLSDQLETPFDVFARDLGEQYKRRLELAKQKKKT